MKIFILLTHSNDYQVVSSAIVDKYIGESARLIREMFNYARDHQPCIIFMDEIDAIGGRRFSEGTSADREIQRTLMELLNQMDGFDTLGKVCFFFHIKLNKLKCIKIVQLISAYQTKAKITNCRLLI